MKVAKKIFVGSIILLFAITPLIASAGIDENRQSLSTNVNNGNSLGTITIEHQPMLYQYSQYHGMKVFYDPPTDHPTFDYYFTELENSTVLLNFTLYIIHYLNRPTTRYIAERFFPNTFRFTWINRFYIHQPGHPADIFTIENKTYCTSDYPVSYNITVGGKYLVTNGTNVTLEFWCLGAPGVTPLQVIYNAIASFPDVSRDLLSPFDSPYTYIKITIHPL